MKIVIEIIPGRKVKIWEEGRVGCLKSEMSAVTCKSKRELLEKVEELLPPYARYSVD